MALLAVSTSRTVLNLAATDETDVVQRAMSQAELDATPEAGSFVTVARRLTTSATL